LGAGEPVGRQLLERGHHRRLDVGRNRVPLRVQRARRFGHDPRHHRLRGGAGEGRLAGEHLVQHGAERVDVRARRDLPLAHRLLGTHVVRRPETHPGLGHPRAARLARGEGNPEIRHERLPIVQQDVLGLDVPVHHVVPVRVVECPGHLLGDSKRVGHRELFLAGEPVAEGLALDVGHDVIQERRES
jgi:hypothetical protein